MPDDAGFGLAPETPGYRLAVSDPLGKQAEPGQEPVYIGDRQVVDGQYGKTFVSAAQMPDNWIMTTRTRSSTMASRNSCSSFSLPSTSVSSQV